MHEESFGSKSLLLHLYNPKLLFWGDGGTMEIDGICIPGGGGIPYEFLGGDVPLLPYTRINSPNSPYPRVAVSLV